MIEFDSFGELRFGHPLFQRVRYVDAAGADEERLAPGAHATRLAQGPDLATIERALGDGMAGDVGEVQVFTPVSIS